MQSFSFIKNPGKECRQVFALEFGDRSPTQPRPKFDPNLIPESNRIPQTGLRSETILIKVGIRATGGF